MLEILAIVWLCKTNKKNAASRGRKTGGFVALTVVLWIGMELLGLVIGSAAGAEFGGYVMGILFAALGGLISYLIAKNCKPGDYISPEDKMIQDVINSPEYLDEPATIEIIREKSMVGALAKYKLTFNGQPLASLANGQSITIQTTSRHNILSAPDQYGMKPFIFDVASGGRATIRFKAGSIEPVAEGALPVSLNSAQNSNTFGQ